MLITNLILAAVTYLSPVHFDVTLAGNFGEPRPNHFHGGLDIKTQLVEGKAVYSIGDGYISRVSVNIGGLGNAVYVRHPEGYTSVYAHLQRFAPSIEAMVRKWQYRHQTTDVDMELNATDCPVAAGQLIALSGDTGASMGPHLHLEIRETATWNMMDPLDFLPGLLEDSVPPKAHSIMAYPVEGEGSFCGKMEQQRFDIEEGMIADSLFAWGKVGFGIFAEDFMQGSYHRYGIRCTMLLVDGEEVFRSDVDNIPVAENKMVNVWGDYDYFVKNEQWFMKSFLTPANKLSILKANRDKGYVHFDQQRDYLITYVLCDFFGNQSRFSFTVTARPDSLPVVNKESNDSVLFKMSEPNSCMLEDISLTVPGGSLCADVRVKPSSRSSRRSRPLHSNEFQFAMKSIPLFDDAMIRLKVNGTNDDMVDSSKLYIAALKRDKRNDLDPEKDPVVCIDSHFSQGWIEGSVSDIGDVFFVALDDTPPRIIPIHENSWPTDSIVQFDLKDEQSGVINFKGFLDDQFVLFDYVKKSSKVICDLRNTPVTPTGRERQLKFLARDRKGNESTYQTTINY